MDRIIAYAAKLDMKKPKLSQMMERTTNNTETTYIEGTSSGMQEVLKEYENIETDETYFEKFEKQLENVKSKGYFVDMTVDLSNDFKIEDIKKQSIIKFESDLLIPEEFGQADFIKTILQNPYAKDALWDSINNSDDISKEFLSGLISEDRNIPIYFNINDYNLYSTLKGNNLCNINYSEFEENVEETVTVLAKVEKIDSNEKEITIYDIYKDLLNMNRAMRRNLSDRENKEIPEKITIYGKGIKLLILAVYK